MPITDWTLPGADGELILGNTHVPADPRGVLVIAHGFKGYKDYGLFPWLATRAAEAGLVAHRFNFSHSGMTNRIETFERPDLFERDTWDRQVEDLCRVMEAVTAGHLEGRGLPLVLFGHSRGGVSVLLTAGRTAGDDTVPNPAGVVTAAAPSRCNMLPSEDAERLLAEGFLESPSARTGQTLRVGRVQLQAQRDDPAGHDVLALAARIRCPVLVVHGADDPTVPSVCAGEITSARGEAGSERIVPGADHVFCTPNPMPVDDPPSEALRILGETTLEFAVRCCGVGGPGGAG